MAPHAGYVYSGPVAAHTYLHVSSMREPQLVVIVAPNHYGVGNGAATCREGVWETPLGGVEVDRDSAAELVRLTGIVDYDTVAHQMEHSLEVQLPFLQELYGKSIRLVPVSLAFQDSETSRAVGRGIAELVRGRKAVLIASSDLTHYEPSAEARAKDSKLIGEIEKLNIEGFYLTLERNRVTACGYGPIAAIMQASKSLGLVKGELLKYANSGDSTGDMSAVVGYGSLRFV